MDDPFDAGDRLFDLGKIGKVGRHEGLVGGEVGRRPQIAQPDLGIDALEELAQPRPDAARRAGDQHCLHCHPDVREREIGLKVGARGRRASRSTRLRA
jgi:hypothetical protein